MVDHTSLVMDIAPLTFLHCSAPLLSFVFLTSLYFTTSLALLSLKAFSPSMFKCSAPSTLNKVLDISVSNLHKLNLSFNSRFAFSSGFSIRLGFHSVRSASIQVIASTSGLAIQVRFASSQVCIQSRSASVRYCVSQVLHQSGLHPVKFASVKSCVSQVCRQSSLHQSGFASVNVCVSQVCVSQVSVQSSLRQSKLCVQYNVMRHSKFASRNG